MSKNPLNRISSSSSLYILHLSANRADIYLVQRNGATRIDLPNSLQQTQALTRFAAQAPDVPWAVLVDQSEETFWGGVMPALSGTAKTAWVERMSDQSGTESPYRWSDIQGKSRSQPDKLRVLGYTLGRPEGLTPWLDALKSAQARIRGVYAPVMLATQALDLLKIKPSKAADDISVLITPHEDGMRQTVFVGARVRFSRLALNPNAQGQTWFETVYQETARLREYLIANSLLKSDQSGMQLFSVLPPSAIGLNPQNNLSAPTPHSKDRYQWLNDPLPNLVYLTALAKRQTWRQLAPRLYRKRDLSVHGTRTLYLLAAAAGLAAAAYLAIAGSAVWQKHSAVSTSLQDTYLAAKQYDAIAKTFPQSPLTAAQLIEMRKNWDSIESITPPQMRDLLVKTGQVMERHPSMLLEDMQWSTLNAPKDEQANQPSVDIMGGANSAGGSVPANTGAATSSIQEVATLMLRGNIRGIASDDLRGTRDALTKLETDFNAQPKLRAEITRRPLDLSTKSTFSGSGQQDKSELSFELKLWQR